MQGELEKSGLEEGFEDQSIVIHQDRWGNGKREQVRAVEKTTGPGPSEPHLLTQWGHVVELVGGFREADASGGGGRIDRRAN